MCVVPINQNWTLLHGQWKSYPTERYISTDYSYRLRSPGHQTRAFPRALPRSFSRRSSREKEDYLQTKKYQLASLPKTFSRSAVKHFNSRYHNGACVTQSRIKVTFFKQIICKMTNYHLYRIIFKRCIEMCNGVRMGNKLNKREIRLSKNWTRTIQWGPGRLCLEPLHWLLGILLVAHVITTDQSPIGFSTSL